MNTCANSQPDATRPPTALVQGDSAAWRWESADYPATAWSAAWHFVGALGTLAVAGVADGDAFDATIDLLTSAGLSPGDHSWALVLTDNGGTQRVTHSTGRMVVHEDPATASPTDPRSWAERALEAVEELLAGKSAKDVQAYAVGGHSVTHMTFEELLDARGRLRHIVAGEQRERDACEGTRSGYSTSVALRIW